MKHLILAAFTILCALPARAGVDDVLDGHILPSLSRFAQAAEGLDAVARADCRAAALREPFHAAFDAWLPVGDMRLGPTEQAGLSIAFWPDAKGFTRRLLDRMIAEKDPVAFDPGAYATVSIAGRGLFALEFLLFDPALSGYGADDYACALVRAVAGDLHAQAAGLETTWRTQFAQILRSAGAPDNPVYLDKSEALRAIYTQILSSLEFTADQRIGRPLGSFDRPRPERAEAWRSGRSLRNVLIATPSAYAIATALADAPLPASNAALARVEEAASRVEDPAFQDITDPQAWLRLEILQQRVRDLTSAIEAEIGTRLGLSAGFNSQDGD